MYLIIADARGFVNVPAFFAVIAAVADERTRIATEPEDLDRGRVERMLAPRSRDAVWVLEDACRIVGCLGLQARAAPTSPRWAWRSGPRHAAARAPATRVLAYSRRR